MQNFSPTVHLRKKLPSIRAFSHIKAIGHACYFCNSRTIIFFIAACENIRLNHLMMIYIHKDRSIDIEKAMNGFILSCEERIHVFGKPKL